MQKQSTKVFCRQMHSSKFCKLHRKTPALESFFLHHLGKSWDTTFYKFLKLPSGFGKNLSFLFWWIHPNLTTPPPQPKSANHDESFLLIWCSQSKEILWQKSFQIILKYVLKTLVGKKVISAVKANVKQEKKWWLYLLYLN